MQQPEYEIWFCVKDFFDGKDIMRNNYEYGLNSKASIKGSSLQMIDKGYLFKKLGKKSIWVIQDTLFHILCDIYNIEMLDITKTDCSSEHTLVFVVTSLKDNSKSQIYNLEVSKCYSTSIQNLQRAISEKPVISEDVIIASLKNKLKGGHFFRI